MTWNHLILTASNAGQAAEFERQLSLLRKLGRLDAVDQFRVLPDPAGPRLGSGVATLCCLAYVLRHETGAACGVGGVASDWRSVLKRLRILILHAGGDSRRLPAYAATGKCFVPLPTQRPDILADTVFDRLLDALAPLARISARGSAIAPGQTVVVAGDVILEFGVSDLNASPTVGVTGFGCPVEPAIARCHGVFVQRREGVVARFLQKPSVYEQARWKATDREGRALVDTGVLRFDSGAVTRILDLFGFTPTETGDTRWNGALASVAWRRGFDLYRELCCAWGTDTTRDDYLAAARDAGSRWHDDALRTLHDAIADMPFHVVPCRDGRFEHLGTTRELVMRGPRLARAAFLRAAKDFKDRGSVDGVDRSLDAPMLEALADRLVPGLANVAGAPVSCAKGSAWIEGCRITAPIRLDGNNLLVGVDVDRPLHLPTGACLDFLPGRSRTGEPVSFVRCYHLDDLFHGASPESATWCGRPLLQWLATAHVDIEDVWPGIVSSDRTDWNARLFPAVAELPSAGDWLWMHSPEQATAEAWGRWRNADRHSFKEMAALADAERFANRRHQLRAEVLGRSLGTVFRGESDFSAESLELALRFHPSPSTLTSNLLAEARRQADAPSPGELFVSARILHSLGTAVGRISDGDDRQGRDAVLGALTVGEDAAWLASLAGEQIAIPPVSLEPPDLIDAAFKLIQDRINVADSVGTAAPVEASRREAVRGRAPARIDLCGGWTDTPPYAMERGGSVVNAAILPEGRPAVEVVVRPIEERCVRIASLDQNERIEFRSTDELTSYRDPSDPFALVKAAFCEVVRRAGVDAAAGRSFDRLIAPFGGGLEIATQSNVPKGTGLGTSSILTATILATLSRFGGATLSRSELLRDTLRVEQALTTGGGWQDQVGGVLPGAKWVSTEPGLIPSFAVEALPGALFASPEEGGLTLLYDTGITRLAKNILRRVVGRYLDRNHAALQALAGLRSLPSAMAAAMRAGDAATVGGLVGEAGRLNRRLDPDSGAAAADRLLVHLAPHLYGAKLMGAGGGGFLWLICRSAEAVEAVRRTLVANPINAGSRLVEYRLCDKGLSVEPQ